MLIQSQDGTIKLLPALPDAWRDGKVSGLMARGGFVVDMNWKNGKLVETRIFSKLGEKAKIQYGGKVVETKTKRGKSYRFNEAMLQVK